jgi:hypothetical protein
MSDAAGRPALPPVDLHLDVAHPSRMYDYYLGGKDNFPADREAADRVLQIAPEVRTAALMNRAFLGRAVRCAAESGVGQFLDIGTGIPSAGSIHEIAQTVDPRARVVYVDNDPIVLAHARALMGAPGHGATHVVRADLREPQLILGEPELGRLLDLGKPVALVLAAILHFIPDGDDPHRIVEELLAPLPAGSMLILSHAGWDVSGAVDPQQASDAAEVTAAYSRATAQLHLRDHKDISRFFTGLDLLEPGLIPLAAWRSAATPEQLYATRGFLGGVGTKP